MKNLLFIPLVMLFYSCCFYNDCGASRDYTYPYKAVYMDRDVFERAIAIKPIQDIDTSGKIYVYQDYIFVNDVYKGFHIYNNQDPSNPVLIHFLEVPGATDMAIKNDVVYINQATDLIALELDLEAQSVTVTKRIADTFPTIQAPDGWSYAKQQEGSVIVDWIEN